MYLFISILAILLICFTLLPLVKHDYWAFRVFDYPRLQKLTLSVICFILLLVFFKVDSVFHWVLTITMFITIIYLSSQVFPFTPFARKQVLTASIDNPNSCISLMIANVYEDNTNTKGCLKEIKKAQPDVLLLLETNKRWDESTRVLEKEYPQHIRVPLENTYGMLLYSKFQLSNWEVKYLVEDDIPSIHCQILLNNGKKIQLYAVHPTPPVPNENPRSTERDKELLLVADLAKVSTIPVIVIGDLNDVAWSYTTELFLKMSGLLDPRRGRGFFNTFHAHYPFMRFPLDHAFFSTDFKLKKIKRLSNFNSDHFPIFINLQHEITASEEQSSMEVDIEDIQVAEEKKQTA